MKQISVLVVEDEIFVAAEMEFVIEDMGLRCAGIAADAADALKLGSDADIALVDLNLRDGGSGPEIGRQLAERHGATVIFVTANPTQIEAGIPGALGVIAKPLAEDELRSTIAYAMASRFSLPCDLQPSRLLLFKSSDAPVQTSAAA